MKDPYEHIHMATNDQLAEYITIISDEFLKDDNVNQSEEALQCVEVLKEAASRLRIKHKVPFNNEAFE